jgi:hypothetical protein
MYAAARYARVLDPMCSSFSSSWWFVDLLDDAIKQPVIIVPFRSKHNINHTWGFSFQFRERHLKHFVFQVFRSIDPNTSSRPPRATLQARQVSHSRNRFIFNPWSVSPYDLLQFFWWFPVYVVVCTLELTWKSSLSFSWSVPHTNTHDLPTLGYCWIRNYRWSPFEQDCHRVDWPPQQVRCH